MTLFDVTVAVQTLVSAAPFVDVPQQGRSRACEPARSPIRVVVGAPEPLYQVGVTCALQRAGLDVVAVADNAADVMRKTRAYHPDVVVVDRATPPGVGAGNSVETAAEIRSVAPETAVVILSGAADEQEVIELLGDRPAGVGYLLKARVDDLDEFAGAVCRVAHGGTAIDPEVMSRLAGRGRQSEPLDDLTGREREVLTLMAEGRSNRYIAGELVVTLAAVERHITSIFAKLALSSNAENHRRVLAVLRYLGRGYSPDARACAPPAVHPAA